jgi:hypothetical protein
MRTSLAEHVDQATPGMTEKCRVVLRNVKKMVLLYKPRFYRYGNMVPAPQMTVRTKYQEKDSFTHSRRTCGAVDTVQACAMELPYRTASRHHDRLMMLPYRTASRHHDRLMMGSVPYGPSRTADRIGPTGTVQSSPQWRRTTTIQSGLVRGCQGLGRTVVDCSRLDY